jgi:hypothetical protein
MNLLQRYSKLKKYKQSPDLSGNNYIEHLDYIIKASTPIKGKDYFDGERGEKGENGYTPIKNKDYFDGEKGESGERGAKFLGKIKTKKELPDIEKNGLAEGDFIYIESVGEIWYVG